MRAIAADSIDSLVFPKSNSVGKSVSEADVLAVHALEEMKKHNISQLVVQEKGKYAGIIHLHDLIKEGII